MRPWRQELGTKHRGRRALLRPVPDDYGRAAIKRLLRHLTGGSAIPGARRAPLRDDRARALSVFRVVDPVERVVARLPPFDQIRTDLGSSQRLRRIVRLGHRRSRREAARCGHDAERYTRKGVHGKAFRIRDIPKIIGAISITERSIETIPCRCEPSPRGGRSGAVRSTCGTPDEARSAPQSQLPPRRRRLSGPAPAAPRSQGRGAIRP